MTESAKLSGAKPRLYQTPSSYYSMIARLALAEGGIAHERVFVDIHYRLSQQQPDYVRINPGMTVPTLVLADRGVTASPLQPGLRLGGWTLSDTEQQAIQKALGQQGYQWRAEGDAWLIRLPPAAEVKP